MTADLWQPNFDIVLEPVGKGFVCFNPVTGDTNVLNAFPGEVITMLLKAPRATPEVCEEMARLCDEPTSAEWNRRVEKVLSDLERIELIRRGD